MKCYIGIGGIGCKTVYSFRCNERHDSADMFYYIDSESHYEIEDKMYTVSGIESGTAVFRNLGRNVINYELYTGKLESYFSDIKTAEKVELVFVVSSFGGFGSAAINSVMDYVQALAWGRIENCTVIAFNEKTFSSFGMPDSILQLFEQNTISFVNEMKNREQAFEVIKSMQKSVFNPGCFQVLIDTTNVAVGEFWKYLGMSVDELKAKDCKCGFMLQNNSKKLDIFISYSSKDQELADTIVDRLERQGFSTWIASRNITGGSYAKQILQGIRDARLFLVLLTQNSISSIHVKSEINQALNRVNDGLIMVPLILDSSELDDDCSYYLCTQEMFYANQPPMEERIHELIMKIEELLM